MSDQPKADDRTLAEIMEALKPWVLHAGEVLVERVEDGSDGQRATMRFAEDEHPFKELERNEDGIRQTRIVHAIFIETDDTGTPVDQQRKHQLRNAELKGGKNCQQFHILKAEPDFQRWLYSERGLKDLADYPDVSTRAQAVELVLRRELLKDRSSKYLDHDPDLERDWMENYVRPYIEWRNERAAARQRPREKT